MRFPTRASLTLSSLVLLLPALAAADASVAYKVHTRDVDTVAVSADGKRMASGGDDGKVVVWEGTSPIAQRASDDGPVDAIAFSPDGKLVAIGTQTGKIVLWDPAADKELRTMSGGSDRIVHLAFLPDGKRLYAAAWDQKIHLWDVKTGKEKATLTGPRYQLFGMALSRDGKHLYSCYSSGDVTGWSTKANLAGPTYHPSKKTGAAGECHAVALSADAKVVAAGFGDGTIVFLDASSGKELRRATVADPVNALAFAPDGTLAAGTRDADLAIVDGAGAVRTLKGHGRPITSVAFSRDGTLLVSGSMDMTVRTWTIK